MARWLQPESYVDVDKCRLSLGEEEFRWVFPKKLDQGKNSLRDPASWAPSSPERFHATYLYSVSYRLVHLF